LLPHPNHANPRGSGLSPGAGIGVGLVLEGGGMRAAYTAGVLDAFMDEDIDLRYVIGVSAGANAGSDYVAGQRERNHRVFVELVADRRYAGFANLLRERSWFGMRFLFEMLPDKLAPFRYEEFRSSPRTLVVAVTDCATGEPAYLQQHGYEGRWFVSTVLRASSSLPVLSPPATIEGRRYTDGGVSDPIPVARSIADGNPRNVVVLTQNAGYRKEPQNLGAAASLALARYPALREVLRKRHVRYNACLDRLRALENAGQAFVLRPVEPLVVDRMERDVDKLEILYRRGYAETLARSSELREWLSPASESPPTTTDPSRGPARNRPD
jgi:predicted patatin/cPLA2 family phospholipase